jgi:hypothetical protein
MGTWKGDTITIIHNNGYRGDVIIFKKDETLSVPFEELRNFVLDHLRHKSIDNLTNMTYEDLEHHFTDGFPPEDEFSQNFAHDTPTETPSQIVNRETDLNRTPAHLDYSLYNDGQNS